MARSVKSLQKTSCSEKKLTQRRRCRCVNVDEEKGWNSCKEMDGVGRATLNA